MRYRIRHITEYRYANRDRRAGRAGRDLSGLAPVALGDLPAARRLGRCLGR